MVHLADYPFYLFKVICNQKIIADKFRTSLGHVEEIDSSKHLYNVSDIKKSNEVLIFSDEDLKGVKEDIDKFIIDNLKQRVIEFKSIKFNINLVDIIVDDVESKLEDKTIDVMSEILQNSDFNYDGDFKGYHFWVR